MSTQLLIQTGKTDRPREPADHRQLPLLRHFALAGLVSILLAGLVLGILYQHFATEQLIRSEQRHNVQLTHLLAGVILPAYGDYLHSLADGSGDLIRSQERTAQLHRLILEQIRDTPIIKLKIFSPKGLTVYSTDLSQIGLDKSAYPGFLRATRGETVSQMSYRDRFYAHANEVELANRNLLSSYVPIYDAGGRLSAVFELYNDISELSGEIGLVRIQLTTATIVVMLLLYSALFLLVKRADRIIKAQSLLQTAHAGQIRHQADHDPLTGLPNRRYFRDLLGQSMTRAHENDHLIAVLFIDLDRFKPINDSLGHQAGDRLLKVIAERLTACCRDSDIVARLGGDEFTIILDRVDHVRHIERCAQRVIDTVSRPIHLDDKELSVGASVGISIYPFDDLDIDELIKHADTAMYHAKDSGRNRYAYYSEEMNAEAHLRLELERDLRTALREGQFEVHYQPRFDLALQRVTGVEALLRWQHPDKGMMPPSTFIPLAEETGLIIPLGQWVLQTACRDIAALNTLRADPLNVSINVSARQFEQDDFIDGLREFLHGAEMAATHIELELTESLLMRTDRDSSDNLSRLKAMGLRLSLDDFGTGYSSLNYIKRLPLDTLKIDRSFIRDAGSNARDAALVAAISGMARNLGMRLVAEGVETEEQMRLVNTHRCDEVQGYLISRPLPLDALKTFLAKENGASLTG